MKCTILKSVLFLSLFTVEQQYSQAATSERKPNIILILADDLGIGDVSAYHKDHIPTPNIDSLGKSGVRFTDAHVSAAVCMPSRAGLLTGRQGTRHGSEFNAGPGLSLEERNIAELLKVGGYKTGAIGKWHLGAKDGRDPLNQGFDEFFGLYGGAGTYIDPQHPDAVNGLGVARQDESGLGGESRGVVRGNQPVVEKEYLTEAFTREAVDYIDRHKKEPFFLYVAFNAPHGPHQTTKKYYDRFPHISDQASRIYAGMVSALDDGVGAIIKKLKVDGLDRETLVVFLSDNGGPDYFRGGPSNANFSGWKRYHLEGGHREPFFISWPGHINGDRIDGRLTSSLDLFPTIAAAAGVEVPKDRPIDGVNLLPIINDGAKLAPHSELFWRAGANFAVREGNWKLIVVNKTTEESLQDFRKNSAGGLLKEGPYDGVSPLGQHTVLFDLDKDPAETKNLASEKPDVVARLREKFTDWNRSNVAPNAKSSRGIPTVIDGVVVQLAF